MIPSSVWWSSGVSFTRNRTCGHVLLMNSFNKTEAAVFSCRLCFLRVFLFISLMSYNTMDNGQNITLFNKCMLSLMFNNREVAKST